MPKDTHLSNDEFFTRLEELFSSNKNKDHGSIYLTQKRLTYDQLPQPTTATLDPDKPLPLQTPAFPDLAPAAQPLPIVVRATNGHGKNRRETKIKLSTIVQPSELGGFYVKYGEVCKSGMGALKPRDRGKKKKDKMRKRKKAAAAAATGGGK